MASLCVPTHGHQHGHTGTREGSGTASKEGGKGFEAVCEAITALTTRKYLHSHSLLKGYRCSLSCAMLHSLWGEDSSDPVEQRARQ